MFELGNVQFIGYAMQANLAIGGKQANGKWIAGNSKSANSKVSTPEETKSLVPAKTNTSAENDPYPQNRPQLRC